MATTIPISGMAPLTTNKTAIVRLFDILHPSVDVSAIELISRPPKGLTSMHVDVGCVRTITVHSDRMVPGADLLQDFCGFGLLNTKASYMHINLVFRYDLESLDEFEMVDEIEESVELSDTECEFCDTHGDYVFGRRVHRRRDPTGREVRHASEVPLPELALHVTEVPDHLETRTVSVKVPFWQRIPVPDDLLQINERHELRIEDATTAVVKNVLMYAGNYAGVQYNI